MPKTPKTPKSKRYASHTDLTKAVMTDESGEWHIIPAEHVNDFVSINRESVIVHQCSKWNADLRHGQAKVPYASLGYWSLPGSVEVACKLCDVPPPESIAKLWLLHNFDTFAGDDSGMGRVSGNVSQHIQHLIEQQEVHFDHLMCIRTRKDDPCPCDNCLNQYGEDR